MTVSKLALAALLATGATGLFATPTLAKEKEAKPAKANYSPAFVKAAQPAQAALKADPVQAEAAVAAAEAAATTDDDKLVSNGMRLQVEQAKIKAGGANADQQKLRAPLEALIANPKTAQDQKGQFTFVLGQLALQRKDNAAAVQYLTQAQQLGYQSADLPIMLTQAKLAGGDAAGGTADLEALIKQQEASGGKAPEQYYRLTVAQYQKQNDKPQQIMALKRWVAAYPTGPNWHDALYLYALQSGSAVTLDKAQLLDVFRLLRQTQGLDQFAYQEYTQKVLDSGLPDEAKSVLGEGLSSGKLKSSANVSAMTAQADRQIGIQGSLAPLEAKAMAGSNGNAAFQTGDAYLSQKNYAKAIALYRAALQKGSVNADAVNTHLGIALAMSGDKEGARAAFNAVKTGTRADIAQFWTVYLDHPVTA